MTRQGHASGLPHGHGGGSLGHTDQAGDDERLFADIRKIFQDVLRMLALHRRAFFIPLCVVSSGVFILSLYYPRTYSAKTSFERRNDPILADLQMSRGASTFKLFRTTIARDLTSAECMAEVVDNIGLAGAFPRNDDGTLTKSSLRRRNALARTLGQRVKISTKTPNEHVDIINISYTGPDPTIGRKLLDEMKATYIRRTMAWVQRHLEGLREYFAAETAEAMEELRAAEREQTRIRLENPYLNPQNPGAISSKLSQLDMERHNLLRRRREYQADLDAHKQMLASIESRLAQATGPASRQDTAIALTRASPETARLMELIKKIDTQVRQLRATRGMTDEHPEIMELLASRRRHQAELQTQSARDEGLAVANGPLDAAGLPAIVNVDASTDPMNSDRARLLVQIAAQEAKIKEVAISVESNERETARLTEAKGRIYELQEEYADISGRVQKARGRYASLASTLGKVEPAIRVNEQNKLLHWSVGQPARGGGIPVNPKAGTIVFLALVAGVAAGVLFVILAEVLDHVYRSSGQVSRTLGLPILDAIDVIVTSQDRRRSLIRKVVITPLVVLTCAGFLGITGSMAYLSIQRPHTYQRIQSIPRAALKAIAGAAGSTESQAAAESSLNL